ncbi:MAG: helix-turn-helix domain-containing protein [Dehalococcoidia bacterium]
MADEAKLTLSVEQAGKILGIGRSLAYDLARRDELPVIRFGKRILVSRPALEKMLSEVKAKAVTQ